MKRLLLLIVFACALMLVSCISEQTAPSQQVDEEEITPGQQVEEQKNTEPFEIDTATYEHENLALYYPQLTTMQNIDLEQKINSLIEEDVILFLKQYQDGESPLEMNYEVLLPDFNTFSILYTGDYNGGMYPTHLFFTTRIDWKKGEKARLSDMFVIDEGFIEILKKATYVDWENPKEPNKDKQAAIIEYLNTFESQDLIEAIKQADHPNPEENPYGVFSYYLNDAVIISIQVPHAIGNHAEFKLRMNDLVKKL